VTVKWLATLLAAMFIVAGCSSGGPSTSGLHDHGGADAANVALVSNNVIVDVTLDPAKVGATTLHMEFAPPGGRLDKVGNVRVTLTNEAAGAVPIDLTLTDDGLNHFHADVTLDVGGEWGVVITADAPGGGELSYRTTLNVAD
jgi:hypothetical protein